VEFLEKENELQRLQLERDLAIANVERSTIKGILQEERLSAGDKEEIKGVKQELSFVPNTHATQFADVSYPTPHFEPQKQGPLSAPQCHGNEVNSAIQEIVSLQANQTELSTLIINQQKISHLHVKELPLFSGDYFEYPAFETAFDSIISSKVPSDTDQLYFLDKYTWGKANDVVKGFLAMSSDSAYERTWKLLDHRFVNPVHVAEAYKSTLRKWPKINRDSSGTQEFSDFLVRCEEAMKAGHSMGDLDMAETLCLISRKLPSYSGIKWCTHAHEVQI